MPTQLITLEDLHSFKSELLESLKEHFLDKLPNDKRYLRSSEVCDLLHISPGKLLSMRNNDQIPFSRIGGAIIYDYDDIIKLIDQNKNQK